MSYTDRRRGRLQLQRRGDALFIRVRCLRALALPGGMRGRGGRELTVGAVGAVVPELAAQVAGPQLLGVGAVEGHVALAAAAVAPHRGRLKVLVKVSAAKPDCLTPAHDLAVLHLPMGRLRQSVMQAHDYAKHYKKDADGKPMM